MIAKRWDRNGYFGAAGFGLHLHWLVSAINDRLAAISSVVTTESRLFYLCHISLSNGKSSNHLALFEPYDFSFVITEGFEDLHVVLTEFRGNPDPGWSLRKVPRRAMYFNRFIVGILYLADIAISEHVRVVGGFE